MLTTPDSWKTGATLSPCRRYRYRLWREWGDPTQRCAFVMLNPSTADENEDDPTIRRCIDFARRWGFGAVDIVNLFAWRATDPSELLKHLDIIGPENNAHTMLVAGNAGRVVMAWGSHKKIRKILDPRAYEIATMLPLIVKPPRDLGTLGRNDDGAPKHPLYLPKFTSFVDHQVVGGDRMGA